MLYTQNDKKIKNLFKTFVHRKSFGYISISEIYTNETSALKFSVISLS